MIDGRRYTATRPTEAGARLWEIETHAAAAGRRRATSVTFAAYATVWIAGFIDDAPDRARFEVVLKRRLVPLLGELPLLEVLRADHDQLYRQLPDADGDGAAVERECLELILEEAAEDLRTGSLDASASVREHRSGC
ncbi:MAG: hypothetical protein EA388_10915 [Nitriliruptor sp.]|nr:MAG: hypothetical protein EA388_10915 [Nitriliruptor sp.]